MFHKKLKLKPLPNRAPAIINHHLKYILWEVRTVSIPAMHAVSGLSGPDYLVSGVKLFHQ